MADAFSGGALVRPLPFAAPHRTRNQGAWPAPLQELVGESTAMQGLFAALVRLAPHGRATLLTGETGTGKTTIARALHALGPQAGTPFQVAKADTWDAVDRSGTVFVPDLDEWPLDAQGTLARALADAAGAPRGQGLHLIAGTTHDLRSASTAGRFRADLYYRVSVFELGVPPLRERREDVPALAALFLRDACTRFELPAKQLSGAAARLLQDLPWPGNLRELRNVIERASVLWDGEVLGDAAVRGALGLTPAAERPALAPAPPTRLDEAQHQHVRAVLAAAGGNKTAAAAHLGVSRRALYRLIDRLERKAPAAASAG